MPVLAFALRNSERQLRKEVNAVGPATRTGTSLGLFAEGMNRVAGAVFLAYQSPGAANLRPIQSELDRAAQAWAQGFTKSVGVECRVGVKRVLYPPEVKSGDAKKLPVKDLCRSSDADYWLDEADEDYTVGASTAFRVGFRREEAFFCNNIADYRKDHMYDNPHYTDEDIQAGRVKYRSTIVWPISHVSTDTDTVRRSVLGFLCVDSRAVDIFDPDVHSQMGWLLARALAVPMLPITHPAALTQADPAPSLEGGT
jgi:hypothetical protein